MKNKKLTSVLFDMDGVIVNSMAAHSEAWKSVLGTRGVVLEDIDIFKREGMSGKSSVRDIFEEKNVPFPDDGEFEDLMRTKHEIFEEKDITVFPYVEDILEHLAENHIPLALVTGSLKRSVAHLLRDDLVSRFDIIVTAEDVVNGKPSPDPYLKALDSLGTDARSALVVENAPMGIESAKRAGLRCFALETTLSGPYLSNADRVFRDHRQLLDFFRTSLP